ncbi:MAG: SIS domain-containing protein [Saprospiraceae bacterium]
MEKEFILDILSQSIEVKKSFSQDRDSLAAIQYQGNKMIECLLNGGTIWFCGNGGSAADAQHIAAELSGRFYLNRKPYAAEALHVNSSFMTAVANDFGYDHVYERAIEALGKKGDILVAISTSGNSNNIILAAKKAKQLGISAFLWSGKTGGQLTALCESSILVPSTITPRIQETHIVMGHILCEWIEKEMANRAG